METEYLHRLIDEKKWTFILREFEDRLSSYESLEDHEQLIWIFEKLDKSFREQNAHAHYLVMWKVAFKCGKVKLAKSYAMFILNYLVVMKRAPILKILIQELTSEGLLKNHEKNYSTDYILGKKGQTSLEDSRFFEAHPEMWKNSKNILKNYLIMEPDWKAQQWKLSYEYVLKFHYDEELFLVFAEKAKELKKNDHKKSFLLFLSKRKVNLKSFEKEDNKKNIIKEDSTLNINYDQLAMDVMSGNTEPSSAEQKRIMVAVHNMSNEELLEKGKDMIVAFGLLGMDLVVVCLCEKLMPLISDVKGRMSIAFMLVQALFNSSDFYKVIDLVDDLLNSEPLLADELIAFDYLKAESLLKLKKYKLAKEIFLKIKKENSHYRMVRERLKYIEEIK